ncbi:NAD(P)H-quinone oxidoreductase subunit 5, chloroplastic [Rhizophlyctis rosea]|uniref:NAD(P)H-quinone oxidoreductase subunit 5, chloroplastic n=1 Tax=Rhizophlyctis rosea TaxID=64517 RepID=A0AAD5X1D2_9FUNG|nr:NAD(P)H-quinone oxidoreductase subunit 5, chloroplastic [Rhizophlyctis rosea]
MQKLTLASFVLLPAAVLAQNKACSLKPDPGFCKAAFPRYYFDSAAGECKVFSWGGCGGVVPFQTEAECEGACEIKADSCALKPEVGPCRALIPKWYYDASSGQCKTFNWGGCQGVVPFQTEAECESSCEKKQNSCSLKPDSGPCEAYIPKWYFDSASGQCKTFIWGGCAGTVPFNTEAECEKGCEARATKTTTTTKPTKPTEDLSECALILCPAGTECKADPKQCFTTPCPQVACVPVSTRVTATATAVTRNPTPTEDLSECAFTLCESGTQCVADPKECFTTPCPQVACVPITTRVTPTRTATVTRVPTFVPETCKDKPCKEGQKCVEDPKQCFTTPCPQYKCI